MYFIEDVHVINIRSHVKHMNIIEAVNKLLDLRFDVWCLVWVIVFNNLMKYGATTVEF